MILSHVASLNPCFPSLQFEQAWKNVYKPFFADSRDLKPTITEHPLIYKSLSIMVDCLVKEESMLEVGEIGGCMVSESSIAFMIIQFCDE